MYIRPGKKYYGLLLSCFFLFLTLVCNAQPAESNTVAIVGDDGFKISFDELNKFHGENFYEQRFPNSEMRGYDVALNQMIVNRLKLLDFFSLGLHKKEALMQPVQRIINEELVYQYYKSHFLEKYINEESIKEYYRATGKEFTYRQIMLNKSANRDPETQSAVDAKIEQILASASSGVDFGTLVSRHSEHQQSGVQGGYAAPANWHQPSTRPFFNQVYKLNEGDLKVLETGNAYFIIRIEKIEDVRDKPLKEVRPQIIKEMEKIYGHQSVKDFNQAKDDVVAEELFEWNEAGLDTLLKWAVETDVDEDEYQKMLEEKLSGEQNFTLLTHSNGKVDAREYLRLVTEVLRPDYPASLDIEDLKGFIEEAVRTHYIVKRAKEAGLEQSVISLNTPSNSLRNQFIKLYNLEMIEAEIPKVTEESLNEFYESNKEKLFYQLAKVNIFAKIFNDFDGAAAMNQRIEQGKTFEEAANKRYQVKTFIINREGEIQSYLSTEKPYLGKAAFELEENEVAGPVEFQMPGKGTQYAVIKCQNKLPEKQLEYSEIKNLEKQFLDYHREQIKQQVERSLKQKYSVEVFYSVLEQKVAALN